MNLLEWGKVDKLVKDIEPDLIIHCAAMIGIAQCEKMKQEAFDCNVLVTEKLAATRCKLIFISSDAVYGGNKGYYGENEPCNPINYYAYTKYEAEKRIQALSTDYVILRTGMYGYNINNRISVAQWGINELCNNNTINAFYDVISNSLYTSQIVEIIKCLIEKDVDGTFNIGTVEHFSRYDFFCKIASTMNLSKDNIVCCSVSDMEDAIKRTKNTTLDTRKISKVIGKEFYLEDGIRRFNEEYMMWRR